MSSLPHSGAPSCNGLITGPWGRRVENTYRFLTWEPQSRMFFLQWQQGATRAHWKCASIVISQFCMIFVNCLLFISVKPQQCSMCGAESNTPQNVCTGRRPLVHKCGNTLGIKSNELHCPAFGKQQWTVSDWSPTSKWPPWRQAEAAEQQQEMQPQREVLTGWLVKCRPHVWDRSA